VNINLVMATFAGSTLYGTSRPGCAKSASTEPWSKPMEQHFKDQIEHILDNFNFGKVQRAIEYLEWTWLNTAAPSAETIRCHARAMLAYVAEHDATSISASSGGFEAQKFRDRHLSLHFIVEEVDGTDCVGDEGLPSTTPSPAPIAQCLETQKEILARFGYTGVAPRHPLAPRGESMKSKMDAFEQKTVFAISYSDLDKLMSEFIGREFQIIADHEARNGSSLEFNIDDKDPRDYHEATMKKLRAGRRLTFVARDVLQTMCKKGWIEPGRYLVECWW